LREEQTLNFRRLVVHSHLI